MEIIAAIMFYSMAEDIKDKDARIGLLEQHIVEIHHKVENIDFDLMKLIGAHSAHAARSNFIDEEHDALIENNKNNIDLLIDTIADAFTSNDESN
tara:strand:- start:224 stop:508 length:285 start_codon:yes stop_codon:yes gene_type:complete